MTIVYCTAMYTNWTSIPIENCWNRFFRKGVSDGSVSQCYAFETNGTYHMTTGLSHDNHNALLRLDFYWKIDNLYNVTYASLSTPAMAVQLYDPRFNSWKKKTVGDSPMETLIYNNIKSGTTRATTYLNHTSSIFYVPQRYRAIKPRDAAAVIGFTPNYIDINTLIPSERTWPLLDNPPNPPFNRSLFHGMLSVQLAQGSIDVKTEVRQHTLLASLALAGGCYGVLTTLYILFFGMTRLTPWGLVHHVPVFISKQKHRKDRYSDETLIRNRPMASSSPSYVPWFFNDKKNRETKTHTESQRRKSALTKENSRMKSFDKSTIEEGVYLDNIQLQFGNNSTFEPLFDDKTNIPHHSGSSLSISDPFVYSPKTENAVTSKPTEGLSEANRDIQNLLMREHLRNNELISRVEELEIILAEYFIDTSYVDQLRGRRKSLDNAPRNSKRTNLP
ncbi:hypothetical protein BY458DRAFT_513940 [Sporodiniella umbellata]|nr:hypothetical protein BY458DRAFT_513940 [Sporodiniella umbellata]